MKWLEDTYYGMSIEAVSFAHLERKLYLTYLLSEDLRDRILSFYKATKKSDHLPRSIFNVPLRPDAPTSLSCIDVSFPLHQAMREILNV